MYEGYDLNVDGLVEMSVYDADTHEIIDREVFGQNGLAQKYLEQEQDMFENNKDSRWWAAPEEEDDGQKDKDKDCEKEEVVDDAQ